MNGLSFSDATDIKLGATSITALYYGSTLIWPSGPTPTNWANEYLQIQALESQTLTTNMPPQEDYDGSEILDVYYSTDQQNWSHWDSNVTLSLQTNDIVYFKGSYIYYSGDPDDPDNIPPSPIPRSLFTTGDRTYLVPYEVNVQGNIMSLVYEDYFIGQTSLAGYDYCFEEMFSGRAKIMNVQNLILPATILAEKCYGSMFDHCTYITSAPALPSTSLEKWCYFDMFHGCSSLTTAPSLPATTLAERCYDNMFNGCSSLTTAPDLPAATMVDYCYSNMFNGCTSLNYVKCLATSNFIAEQSTYYWLNNTAASGTFVKDANTTWNTGISGIPSGWTVQDA